MAKVTFTGEYHYRPKPNVWITYREGETRTDVKREAIDDAVAKGLAYEHRGRRTIAHPLDARFDEMGAKLDRAIRDNFSAADKTAPSKRQRKPKA